MYIYCILMAYLIQKYDLNSPMNMKYVATVYTCETINDIKYTRRLYVPMFYETQ